MSGLPWDKCFIIAEVAQAHDGSLGLAHSYVDAVARVGADAIKFQTHIAAAESTLDEPWRVRFSRQDRTRLEYWRRMEFSEEEWRGLRAHAKERGLGFLSSPFSAEAVDLLKRVGVDVWKIASGEITNLQLYRKLQDTELPVLISTGMSGWSEIDGAVERARGAGLTFVLLQCTSVYPTPPARTGLNVIGEFRERYGCPVGLSDHSGTPYAALAAAALGIAALEVHVTLSRELAGPDVDASLTTAEFAELVRGVRAIEEMIRNPVDKDTLASELSDMRDTFMRSVAVRVDLPKGTLLTPEHLTTKKPGTGMPLSRMNEIVGRTLRRDVSADVLLRETDLD